MITAPTGPMTFAAASANDAEDDRLTAGKFARTMLREVITKTDGPE
jgi:hypothetical protein